MSDLAVAKAGLVSELETCKCHLLRAQQQQEMVDAVLGREKGQHASQPTGQQQQPTGQQQQHQQRQQVQVQQQQQQSVHVSEHKDLLQGKQAKKPRTEGVEPEGCQEQVGVI